MLPATLISAGLAMMQGFGAAPLPDPAKVQANVLRSCRLEPRLFTVEKVGNQLRVQRSPTLSDDQGKCVDYILSQWQVKG